METTDLIEHLTTSRGATARRRMLFAWLALTLVALISIIGAHRYQRHLSDTVYNVRVGGLQLENMTLPTARQMLHTYVSKLHQLPLTLKFTDEAGRVVHSRTVSLEEAGITPDADATWRETVRAASRWSTVTALFLRKIYPQAPADVPLRFTVDNARSERFWRQMRQTVERPPRDARLTISGDGTRQIVPAQAGLKLLVNPMHTMLNAVQRLDTTINIPLQTVQPRVTSAHLQTIDTQLTKAVTRFSEAQRNRSHNIRQAAARINGLVLLPGETFSYNQTVGPRTLREGFRKAPVIVKGELVEGDGGGVCQVSSTLYMAALQAGLEIVQRSKHAFPIGYAPAGLDATVVYGVLDLRFRNNTPYPIAIGARAQRGRMTVEIWGNSAARRRVRIRRVVHSVTRAPIEVVEVTGLPAGVTRTLTKGHAGMRVSVYRIIEEPGKPPIREKVSSDIYRPQARVVMVGKAPRPENKPGVLPVSAAPTADEEPLLHP